MFVILVNYVKPIEEVDRHLAAHRAFLDQHYAAGSLICSGPQNPRTGGVIVSRAATRAEAERVVAQDPFRIHGIAEYTLIEFSPVKFAEGFEKFL